ncbi:hypothetical protein BH09ACT8_BH09ACT8_57990 [soil metagenome]
MEARHVAHPNLDFGVRVTRQSGLALIGYDHPGRWVRYGWQCRSASQLSAGLDAEFRAVA